MGEPVRIVFQRASGNTVSFTGAIDATMERANGAEHPLPILTLPDGEILSVLECGEPNARVRVIFGPVASFETTKVGVLDNNCPSCTKVYDALTSESWAALAHDAIEPFLAAVSP